MSDQDILEGVRAAFMSASIVTLCASALFVLLSWADRMDKPTRTLATSLARRFSIASLFFAGLVFSLGKAIYG